MLGTKDKKIRKKLNITLNQNMALWTPSDLFDVIMRVTMSYLMWCFSLHKTYDPAGTSFEETLSPPDKEANRLTGINWIGRTSGIDEKFSELLASVANIVAVQSYEKTLRIASYFMLFFMMIRVIVYMDCHPRIAIVYKTVTTCFDNMTHFLFIFTVVYVVFAYSAYWMIGAENSEFETFGQSLWTQFKMSLGNFPFNEKDPSWAENFYMASFAAIVFILMVNSFFLAVIVEAYDSVKEATQTSVVELNVFKDVFQTFFYYVRGLEYGWPDREAVAIALAGLKLDNEGGTDIEEEIDRAKF